MKLGTKIGTMLCAGLLFAAACKKKEDSNNVVTPEKTKRDFLIEGKWQISAMSLTYTIFGASQTSNLYDSMDACEKDNFGTFKGWGKIYSDEGATKCNASDPQIDSTQVWSLTSDNNKLYFGEMGNFDVQELTATSLKLYQSFDTTISGIPASTKTTVVFKNIN